MKTHIEKHEIEAILDTMNKFNFHDDYSGFELDIDNSSGIERTISLSAYIGYNTLIGKFTVVVNNPFTTKL